MKPQYYLFGRSDILFLQIGKDSRIQKIERC